jgi:hypothetical protein
MGKEFGKRKVDGDDKFTKRDTTTIGHFKKWDFFTSSLIAVRIGHSEVS